MPAARATALDPLAERHFQSRRRSTSTTLTKAGKTQDHLRRRRHRPRHRIRRRATPTSCCGSGRCSSRGSPPSACAPSTRRWSGRCSPCSARMERRGISIDRHVLSRLSGEFAQEAAGLEAEINKLAGETVNPGSPKAARRHSVRQARPAGRHQDQDRPMGDRRARARGTGRAGPRAAAENPRLAAGVEAEIDLHRRAAGLRQSDDASRAHQLRARRHHDRPAVVVRAQSAEHPGPHRGRPQDPPRLRRRAGHASSSPPTIRRSSCGSSPRSPTSSRCARRSATASTSTP